MQYIYAIQDISNLNIVPIKFNINGKKQITARIIAILTHLSNALLRALASF
ncbi:MAG: hypothetical protein L6V81_01175 [Clostridium sp.]|nr:MAG: hypothetical protein L6V81_01175 [Clostridium sp.]